MTRIPSHPADVIAWRFAAQADLEMLAEWNHQLIADEGHRNPMDVPQLRERMAAWIVSDYKAVIFLSPEAVGYALYAAGSDSIYLRQFFIRRDRRRMGLGRLSFEVLGREVWPKGQRLTVEVLCSNLAATSFWHSVGYRDHFVGMEIPAQTP